MWWLLKQLGARWLKSSAILCNGTPESAHLLLALLLIRQFLTLRNKIGACIEVLFLNLAWFETNRSPLAIIVSSFKLWCISVWFEFSFPLLCGGLLFTPLHQDVSRAVWSLSSSPALILLCCPVCLSKLSKRLGALFNGCTECTAGRMEAGGHLVQCILWGWSCYVLACGPAPALTELMGSSWREHISPEQVAPKFRNT